MVWPLVNQSVVLAEQVGNMPVECSTFLKSSRLDSAWTCADFETNGSNIIMIILPPHSARPLKQSRNSNAVCMCTVIDFMLKDLIFHVPLIKPVLGHIVRNKDMKTALQQT